MATHRLGIIMHGVTGRMGLNQHLERSIVAIRKAGGVVLPNGDRVMPDPILVGRNAEKVAALARQYDIERHTTDLEAALNNPADTVFFDADFLPQPSFLRETVPSPEPADYPSPAELRTLLDNVHEQVLLELADLADEVLDEPPGMPHPLFSTKLGSLLWCSQHEMLHAGQIGLLRRLLGHKPLW